MFKVNLVILARTVGSSGSTPLCEVPHKIHILLVHSTDFSILVSTDDTRIVGVLDSQTCTGGKANMESNAGEKNTKLNLSGLL